MPSSPASASEGASVRRRVLIITGDVIGTRMAGPAIRVWNMAAVLSLTCDVRVVSWSRIDRMTTDFELHYVHEADDRTMSGHEDWADVVVVQGIAFRVFPSIARTRKAVVADLYDPFHLEQLEQNKHRDAVTWTEEVTKAVSLLNEQLTRADCIICASERQQTLWLGALSSVGRINPLTYAADPTFDSFVRIVPFGLPDEDPVQTRRAIKGTVPGIAEDDKVLIWGGGIYDWFDPVTLVKAVGRVVQRHPEVKLFFLSARHFNPDVPEMQILAETVRTADELGLTDRHVFFNDGWVDYEDRVNYLLDADAGVSTHPVHLETRFSFRTRILDYLWTRLPVITTDGDSFADLVRQHDLGAVVPPSDPEALATAIIGVLFDEELRARVQRNVDAVRAQLTWERVLAPLVEYCADPLPAPDAENAAGRTRGSRSGFEAILAMPKGPRRDVALLAHYLRTGGVSRVREKLTERRRRLSR